jgi:hypothetical protein
MAPTPQLGDPGEQPLHVLDGVAAALDIEVADKAVVDQTDTREHDAPVSRISQVVEPLAPVAGPAQLDAVEARGGCELPFFEDLIAREELLLTR